MHGQLIVQIVLWQLQIILVFGSKRTKQTNNQRIVYFLFPFEYSNICYVTYVWLEKIRSTFLQDPTFDISFM